MRWLSHGDVSKVLGHLPALYESADVEHFAVNAAQVLLNLVPADRCSYNELYREPGKLRSRIVPQGFDLAGSLLEAMSCHGHENPPLAYYRQTQRAEVCAFSDFVTQSQLHRIPLYNEYYRYVEVEHQVVIPLSLGAGQTRETGFALSRRRPDFSPRDRHVLEVLQPHLIRAHANARVVERLGVRQTCVEGVLSLSGQAIIVVSDEGKMLFATGRSREMLAIYFDAAAARSDRLPDSLARWMRRQQSALRDASEIERPRGPLVVAREGKRLTVTLTESEERRLLLFEEREDEIDPSAFEALGLTRRQNEVLAWVAQGKTNEAIAKLIGARPATVAKHLERIYRRLGVETRTAAAIEALSVARKSAAKKKSQLSPGGSAAVISS